MDRHHNYLTIIKQKDKQQTIQLQQQQLDSEQMTYLNLIPSDPYRLLRMRQRPTD